jgi:hypothetical protein
MGDRINRANTIAQSLTFEDDRAVLISMRLAIVDAQMPINQSVATIKDTRQAYSAKCRAATTQVRYCA